MTKGEISIILMSRIADFLRITKKVKQADNGKPKDRTI